MTIVHTVHAGQARLKNFVVPANVPAHRLAQFLTTLPSDSVIHTFFLPMARNDIIIRVWSESFPVISDGMHVPEVHYREWEGRPDAG